MRGDNLEIACIALNAWLRSLIVRHRATMKLKAMRRNRGSLRDVVTSGSDPES